MGSVFLKIASGDQNAKLPQTFFQPLLFILQKHYLINFSTDTCNPQLISHTVKMLTPTYHPKIEKNEEFDSWWTEEADWSLAYRYLWWNFLLSFEKFILFQKHFVIHTCFQKLHI